ncbi:MAG: hypothetical protein F4W90_00305 [Gammaproteobacteria bacterium]|nr:hypothetical protein [Gammaproteobacteria bacterium]
MKILGYALVALAVVVAAVQLSDGFYLDYADTVWVPLDILMCVGLLICVVITVMAYIENRTPAGVSANALLAIFAFVTFTETWINHELGTATPGLQWLWVDALVVIALLRVGSGLLAASDST